MLYTHSLQHYYKSNTPHECFSGFLNYTNGTKSRKKALHVNAFFDDLAYNSLQC